MLFFRYYLNDQIKFYEMGWICIEEPNTKFKMEQYGAQQFYFENS
jgi:hypothetical protein